MHLQNYVYIFAITVSWSGTCNFLRLKDCMVNANSFALDSNVGVLRPVLQS